MLIKTTYKTNAQGKGQILATGGKRQRTVTYDHSASIARNHGLAAGELALALGLEWSDKVLHDTVDDGQHLFLWGTDALIDLARQAI